MFCIRRATTQAAARLPVSARAFSASAPRPRGGLPVFVAPSSPELGSLLSTFNSKVLLPWHLSPEQQKLVYSQEGQTKLNAEPVEVTIGDVTLPLEPLDRNVLPDRARTLREIVKSSSTREDWENVVRALEGLESAGVNVRPQWQELVVRKLGDAGMYSVLLKALQRPRATTMRLSNKGVLEHVLRVVHDRAAAAKWDKDSTAASLRLANQIVELMETEDHHTPSPPKARGATHTDNRSLPTVIALPTELAAVAAERHSADTGPVKTLVSRLLAACEQTKLAAELSRADLFPTLGAKKNNGRAVSAVAKLSVELSQYIIVWNALATSRRVLGAAMPGGEAATKLESLLERTITQGLKTAEKLNKVGTRYPVRVQEMFKGCKP